MWSKRVANDLPIQFMNMYSSYKSFIISKEHILHGIVWEIYEFDASELKNSSLFCIPDGCPDIIFILDGKPDDSYALGCFVTMSDHIISENTKVLGIRFVPGQFNKMFHIPVKEFLGKKVVISDVCANTETYYIRLMEAETYEQRVAIAIDFVKDKLAIGDELRSITDFMVKSIIDSGGVLRLGELSQAMGYTERHIRNIFNQNVGISPKNYCEVVKFQRAIYKYFDNVHINMEELAWKTGYYDLAHMTKSFKHLTGCTPGVFLHELKSTSATSSCVV